LKIMIQKTSRLNTAVNFFCGESFNVKKDKKG